jgi:hypothetical protein
MVPPNFLTAHLWISEGIYFTSQPVKNLPPTMLIIALLPDDWNSGHYYPECDGESRAYYQEAWFELRNWSEGGEVCHYDLINFPPKGYRWLVYNKIFRSQKIKENSYV